MCDEINKSSKFYKDEERHQEACDALMEMKKLREGRGQEMTTIILPNGARVSSTNSERLKEYEKYSKRKAGYFTQLK